jgi:cytochrome c-type biogenesis protein CcmH
MGFGQDPVRRDSVASPRAGQGDVGTLFNPEVAGRSRVPTAEGDNDAVVRNTELKLGCTCGCTLDIFTCRTTDFTCTYSPALHREVVALFAEGKTSEQVIAAFVDKYGEKILMAPKAEGFNIAGYVVPGVGIVAVGGIVAWIIRRRVRMSAARTADAVTLCAPPGVPGTSEEMERLTRELAEMER